MGYVATIEACQHISGEKYSYHHVGDFGRYFKLISHLGQHTVVINESSTTAATAYWLLVPVNYGLAREPEVGHSLHSHMLVGSSQGGG